MNIHNQVNYLEIPAKDIAVTKAFFTQVFDWEFMDFGDEYCSFTGQTVNGGFYLADTHVSLEKGSPLIVLFSDDLSQTQTDIEQAGGSIIQPEFSFPGGRRFHFADPNGNEFAVWA
ncbi:VOC family protein [Parashewanella curva]|uniref:VOC family protein n=1 Tax=Parashewanella curva TaxID=2338552 RepID=A0A3L8PRE2_9GAMM|nr:VOC family protein [Parashewanella curva]RLV57960.1 VOC family protein [Parashewanella curva]